jgi:ribosomal protein L29
VSEINPELLRKDNETELQHHKRIIYGKLVDKTLSDEDYSDLSEVAYGQRLSSDVARREFYGSKQTLDIIDRTKLSELSDDNYVKEIEIKKRELATERQKLNATNVEYTRNIRQQSRFELYYENVRDAITTLPLPEFYPIITELENVKEYPKHNPAIIKSNTIDIIKSL